MTLWKDREYVPIAQPDRATGFKTRERKSKAVTVIPAVEGGTKPGSTKPTWKLSSK